MLSYPACTLFFLCSGAEAGTGMQMPTCIYSHCTALHIMTCNCQQSRVQSRVLCRYSTLHNLLLYSGIQFNPSYARCTNVLYILCTTYTSLGSLDVVKVLGGRYFLRRVHLTGGLSCWQVKVEYLLAVLPGMQLNTIDRCSTCACYAT